MSSLFISDLHLEDNRPEAWRLMYGFLSGPARQAEVVYILGDLFEYWIGDDAPPPGALELARHTRDLDAVGVPCHFIHGNRAALDVMREEIFGPLLPLVPYDRIEDAVARINSMPKPLALYWFDEDEKRTAWALHNTQAGGVCVNETLMHVAQEELPFGGVGPSGMGHYHGRHGFETFSKMTPVFVQSKLNGMGLFMPPYGAAVRRMLELMKRF